MIEFINEETRTEFYLLPVDKQTGFVQMADSLLERGFSLVIIDVDRDRSEVTVRVDEKFKLDT